MRGHIDFAATFKMADDDVGPRLPPPLADAGDDGAAGQPRKKRRGTTGARADGARRVGARWMRAEKAHPAHCAPLESDRGAPRWRRISGGG